MASYRKLGKSNWQYIISYKDDSGKNRQKTKSGFPTKTAAKDVAGPLEKKIKQNVNVLSQTMLFTDYYERWVNTYKTGLYSPITDSEYKTAKNLVEKHFTAVKMEDLTMDKYQEFINTLAEDKAKETVRKYHNKVGACLRHAFRTGILTLDVTYNARITGKPGQKTEDKFLSEKELKKVTAELQKDIRNEWTSRWMLLLQSATGMRLAEVMAITFSDVDLKNETLRINKSWDYKHTNSFKNTKNGVHRIIDLDKKTIKWLRVYMNFQRQREIGSVIKNDNKLIFTDDKFEPVTEKALNEALKAACRRAKTKEVTSHALRHTHASVLLMHGVDIQIVAERLGDTVETIHKVYAHVLSEMRDRDKEKIKKIAANLI